MIAKKKHSELAVLGFVGLSKAFCFAGHLSISMQLANQNPAIINVHVSTKKAKHAAITRDLSLIIRLAFFLLENVYAHQPGVLTSTLWTQYIRRNTVSVQTLGLALPASPPMNRLG